MEWTRLASPDESSLVRKALDVYGWAEDRQLLASGLPPVASEGMRREGVPEVFAAGQEKLVTKPIVAVGVNHRRNEDLGGTLFVYTRSALSKRSQEELKQSFMEGVALEFRVIKPFSVVQGQTDALVESVKPAFRADRVSCGSSIGPVVLRDAGTLGALVRDDDGVLYGLSANHVIGACSNVRRGTQILFPGLLDVWPGGVDPLTIGYYDRGLSLTPGNPRPLGTIDPEANCDAALFRVRDAAIMTSMQQTYFDTPTGTCPAGREFEDMPVEKVGRSTGRTIGNVESLIVQPQPIRYKFRVPTSPGQEHPIEMIVYFAPIFVLRSEGRAFAAAGDSGALVVSRPDPEMNEDERLAIGLLIGGEGDIAFMLPIQPILDRLEVGLVGGV